MSIRKRTWTSRGVERSAWIVDYFDQSGKRHIKTFATRKEADAWSVTARSEVKQGIHTAASASVTVAECGDRWLEHCRAEDLEFGTIRQRRQHLNLHILPLMGREKLSELSMPRIYQFDADLRGAGRSLAMRKKVLGSIKAMLTFAQKRGLVAQNVALGVRLKSDDRQAAGPLREGVDFPSKAELKLLIERAPARHRPLLITAIFTGMRASELRGLLWSDVDLDAGVIHVRRRADAWNRVGPPKSKAGKRDILLTPMAINALRQHAPAEPEPNGLVFGNRRGNIERMSNLHSRFWGPLQVACGLVDGAGPRYTFHCLRHAAASLFIAHLGRTPKRVQAVMGHASVTMTYDRYGHLFEDHDADREAMKKIEAAILAA
jgi:integrase